MHPTTVHILYASETGTSEDHALHVAETLHETGRTSVETCTTLDAYNLAQLPAHAAAGHRFVFLVSTCGDGEVPRNMLSFWTFLRRADLPPAVLNHLRFSIFGFGDRAYVLFNAAARKLSARFLQLGASAFVPLALGDDSAEGGFQSAFDTWLQLVMQVVCPAPTSVDSRATGPHSLVAPGDPRIAMDTLPPIKSGPTAADSHLWRAGQCALDTTDAHVVCNKTLTDAQHLDDDREVRHLRLSLASANADAALAAYEPGDVVHIQPRNRPSAVDALLQLMELRGDDLVTVRQLAVPTFRRVSLNVRTPCTVRELASAQFDLWATPRPRFLKHLAAFANDAAEHRKLLELASPDGGELYVQYALREKRTVLMVLRDFPSARPSLARLVELIPRLRSRAFSIASARQCIGEGVLDVCVTMVRYQTVLRFARVGVCSSFLQRLAVGALVPVSHESGRSLRFRVDKPALILAAGTGVAPMRAFLGACTPGVERLLVFGCRHAHGDYLYAAEWVQRVCDGVLTDVEPAFSRMGSGKTYVQARVLAMAQRVWRLVHADDAVVYVAGAAGGFPKGVRRALVDVAMTSGGLDESEAEMFLQRLQTEGRLQMECW